MQINTARTWQLSLCSRPHAMSGMNVGHEVGIDDLSDVCHECNVSPLLGDHLQSETSLKKRFSVTASVPVNIYLCSTWHLVLLDLPDVSKLNPSGGWHSRFEPASLGIMITYPYYMWYCKVRWTKRLKPTAQVQRTAPPSPLASRNE